MYKCPRCGVSRYKVKDNDECSSDENTKKDPQQRCYGIFLLFQGLNDYLLTEMTQKTLHDMQMGETMMECFAIIRLIFPNGRKLIVCIHILERAKKS